MSKESETNFQLTLHQEVMRSNSGIRLSEKKRGHIIQKYSILIHEFSIVGQIPIETPQMNYKSQLSPKK